MEITSTRHSMFDVPVWDFDLSEALTDIRDELVADALEAARQSPLTTRPFRQSMASLGGASQLWADVISTFRDIATSLIEQTYRSVEGTSFPQVREIRCWSLVIDGREQWDAEAAGLRIVHNHPGSTLSSVLFLDGPADDRSGSGGTMFMNPLSHVADPRLIPKSMVVPWRLMHLVLFPSWLEHGPMRPSPGGGPRLTVAADYLT